MYTVKAKLVGRTPLGFSKVIQSKKAAKESHDDFEERTWRERIHQDSKGNAFINPMSMKNCLSAVAKYLSETVPGKGKATYTKHFLSGVACSEPLMLGVKAKNIPAERLFVPSDGRKGGGSRVWKNFPKVEDWETEAEIIVVDPFIKPEKIEEYLKLAGKLIGLGFFRPGNGGYWGKFDVKDFKVVK